MLLFTRYIFFLFLCAPALAGATAVCVKSDRANLRTGPSNQAAISWVVGKYMPLRVTGQRGNWLQVEDLDKETHWIHSSLVSQEMRCLVVSSNYTYLRTGPSPRASLSSNHIADKYTPFRDLGGEDGWTQVEDHMERRGWINLERTWRPVSRRRIHFDSN